MVRCRPSSMFGKSRPPENLGIEGTDSLSEGWIRRTVYSVKDSEIVS